MHHLVQVWFEWVEQWGYFGIILLMAMESSIFPVPSEIVIPPAAFLATEGKLNVFGVIAAGTFGSWLGAAVTYWVSWWLGRVFIARWGRFFLVSERKLERAEAWLRRYEAWHFLCASVAGHPPYYFHPGWNHADELRHVQHHDARWIRDLVLSACLVWPKSTHARYGRVKRCDGFD